MARVNLLGRFNPPTYQDTRIEVFAYLVMGGSDIVLVDTGVGEGNSYVERTFEPNITSMKEELARFALATSDINLIVNSHLHFDHCGNNTMFPQAEIFIQRAELAVARMPNYTITDWFDYEGAQLHEISGETEVRPGITLIASPGHTPGHQSVLIETAEGNVLVAAQAAYTADEFRRGGDPEEQAHEGFGEQYLQSIADLKSVGAQKVFFSHDDKTVKSTAA